VPPQDGPVRGANAAAGVRLAARLAARMRAPSECRDAARLAAGLHAAVDAAADLAPAKLLDLIMRSDALRRPERLEALLAVCECRAAAGLDPATVEYAQAAIVRDALAIVRGVKVAAVAARAMRAGADSAEGDIARAIRAARLAALREWKRARTAR